MQLQATQIRAARAILDWSQEELAGRSGVCITTIRKVESGFAPRRNTVLGLRDVFENEGLEFTENEGVRRRAKSVTVLSGENSCQEFYDDIFQTVMGGYDEVFACLPSYKMFVEINKCAKRSSKAGLKRICEYASVKCLTSDHPSAEEENGHIKIKQCSKFLIRNPRYYVYGSKHALVLPEGEQEYRFVIFDLPRATQRFRVELQNIWFDNIPREELLEMKSQIDKLL